MLLYNESIALAPAIIGIVLYALLGLFSLVWLISRAPVARRASCSGASTQ